MNNPTAEDIKKAKEILGLIKADGTEINKADKMTIEKAEVLKAEYKENLKKAEEFMKKAEAIKVELEEAGHKMGETNGDDSEILSHKKAEETELQKAKDTAASAKAELERAATAASKTAASEDNLIKAMNEKFTALSTLIEAKENENSDLKKSLEDLAAKVELIGKTAPGPRSLTGATARERFQKTEDGDTVLSLKNNRREITAQLVKAAKIGEKDQDDIFAKAASYMEIAGTIGATNDEALLVAKRIQERLKIKIIA